ncbi:MAG TPA: hypothetical protein VFI65_18150 [Streptosporangiaceae bacterium]|nr:hypothetical protein [Streptosporangiaceae bacterium]
MKKMAAAGALSLLAVLVSGCNFGSHAAPSTTHTVTVVVTPSSTTSPSPTQVPTQVPTSTAPPISSLGNITVCIAPVVTCQGELKSQPEMILLSGDGSLFVNDLAWTGWGSEGATGHGTLKIDNCKPNCAQGSFKDYEATIVVDNLTPYGNGKQAYDTMNVEAPGTPFGSHTYHNLAP